MRVGGGRGGDQFRLGRIRPAEPQVFLDRAVEQVGVLRHHGDHAAHLRRVQRRADRARRSGSSRAAARCSRDSSRTMVDLPEPLGPTIADPLAGADPERQAGMRRPPAAGIGEADVVEHDLRRQRPAAGRRRSGAGDRRVQQRVDPGRRRLPVQPLVQHAAQVAQRAEDLGPGHQHDQQRLQAHLAVPHPPGAQRQRRGGAQRGAEVGEARGSARSAPAPRTCCPTALGPWPPASGHRRRSGRTPSASAGPAPRRGTPRRTT